MSNHVPHVVIIGATSMDRVRIHPDLQQIEDGKFHAGHSYSAVGGGGANVAIALKEISNALKEPCRVTLFTKIGRESMGYSVRHEAYEHMQAVGLDVRDMVANQDFRMDDNTVISFAGGRFVSLKEEFKKAKEAFAPLVAPSAHSEPPHFDPGMKEQIIEAIRDADLVIVTHHYPEMAQAAALAAHEEGIPVLMDYPVTKAENASKYDVTLAVCDYILAPAEARLSDMTGGNYKNGNSLFSKLSARFPEKFVAVSDGTNPVLTHQHGQKGEIPVEQCPVIDALGTGDVRTAAFAFYTIKGSDPTTALKRGTALASFSVQYPGRDWVKEAPQFMRTSELFYGQSANQEPYSQPDQGIG